MQANIVCSRRPSYCTRALCMPSMGDGPEVKVLSELGRRDRSEPQGADCEGSAERSGGANPLSRRTETGYEAVPSRGSGHRTAKLSRPTLRRCKSGGCAGKAIVLTRGDLALRLKGRRRVAIPVRSEKSAEAVVADWGAHMRLDPAPPDEGPNGRESARLESRSAAPDVRSGGAREGG